MKRSVYSSVILAMMLVGHGSAATFTVQIEATSSTSVVPGGTVHYQITGLLTDDGNLGLAVFGVDLETNTGVAQPQATADTAMAPFVKNAGLANPLGYGGTPAGDDLLQIGGGQNSIGNDGVGPNPPYPSGVVHEGIALGTSVVLAEGVIQAPDVEDTTYTVSLANPFAGALGPDMTSYYVVQAADAVVGANGSFQIHVTPPDADGDGILDDGDGNGTPGDHPCTGGNTVGCDDNCPQTPNPNQEDFDSNGIGDACDTPEITAWRSIRTHDAAGEWPIVLDAAADVGTAAVEGRVGGIQKIEVDFDHPVQLLAGAAIEAVDPAGPTSYPATSFGLISGGMTLEINFAPGLLPDQAAYLIDLTGTVAIAGWPDQVLGGDTDCAMRALEGDASGNGLVNNDDMAAVRGRRGQAVTDQTCPHDVNTSGAINNSDTIAVRVRWGNQSPSP